MDREIAQQIAKIISNTQLSTLILESTSLSPGIFWDQDSGLRVQGLGLIFRVWGCALDVRVKDSGFRIQGWQLSFGVVGLGIRIQCFGVDGRGSRSLEAKV